MSELHPSAPVPTICPDCNHAFEAVDPDRSTYFVCPECRSYFVDEWDSPKEAISSFSKRTTSPAPVLLPGTSASIHGARYRVAGYVLKQERQDPDVVWTEYILYEKNGGSATLVEFDGTWMLVRPVNQKPKQVARDQVSYQHTTYYPYHEYAVNIINAGGCFDWNILDDEKPDVWEYANGERRLILEATPGAPGNWYHAISLDRQLIAAAFRVQYYALPGGTGSKRGGAENPYEPQLKPMYTIAMVAVILVGLLQLGINYLHPSSVLLNAQYVANSDSASNSGDKPIATEAFTVASKSSLQVELSAPLDNNWLEVGANLVNDKTGQVFESVKSLEQYHGYEGGESWTESDNVKEITFSSVPRGSYHLNITASGERNTNSENIPVGVRVSHSNWVLSNFVLLLILIAGFPIFTRILSNQFNENN